MTDSDYSRILKRANFWGSIAFGAAASLLMTLLLCLLLVWFPEIQKMTMIFRDHTKPVADDGFYGGICGLLIGVTFALPTILLPALVATWIHRKLGVACPECGASLTLLRRTDQIKMQKSRACCKCHAIVLDPP